jgi:general stress protein CsbA
LIIVGASILSYYFEGLMSVWLKIVGSSIGTLGVMVCTSEALWLLKNSRLNENRVGFIRLLDVVSLIVGFLMTAAYWLTDGIWFINDILAVCTIIAGMKLLKIRSLKTGMFMLYVMLLC